MSFPYHDPNWVEVADFLDVHWQRGERVLAPDPFWWRLPAPLDRWVSENLRPDRHYEWVVAHKGDLAQFPRSFLEQVVAHMRPVLANEVFVVWTTTDARGATVDPSSAHLVSFHEVLASLPAIPATANVYEQDRTFEREQNVLPYRRLPDAEMRAAENDFHGSGGYQYPTSRDRRYYADLHVHLSRALARWAGGRVLDLACGAYALDGIVPGTLVARIDFAEVGLRSAVAADHGNMDCRHLVMDAHDLGFASGSFDGVAIADSIEHVRDAAAVVCEAARVLRPGGEFLVTFASRNSLNQVVMRSLGYPEFVTNHHHIREFTPDEMYELLAGAGLMVIATAGVSFLPYWGIPGIDDVVREITDDDPVVVDLLAEVGRRAGIEYAYVGVVLARKE